MPQVELPSWDECETRVNLGRSNPIELFVVENEPAGPDAKQFREQLIAALNAAASFTVDGKPMQWVEGDPYLRD